MSRKLHPVRKSLVKALRPRAVPLRLEALEARVVLDVRSITGAGNNIANPSEGMGNTDLLRVEPVVHYADGISAPATPNTLSPREISNNLSNQSDPIFSFNDILGSPNAQRLSDYAYAFGQFIDHDMDLTLDNSGTAFNIPADPTRPADPMGVEPFTRSQFDPKTGTSTSNPRQQINLNTSFLDLSQVYGSTDGVSSALRSHVGGQLKTSPGNFLPLNNTTYFTAAELATISHDEGGIANDAHQVPDSQLFVAGDKRVNEVIELTAQQTLFMRNHNSLAGQLQNLHPTWTDEQLFQEARKLNIAEYQNIVFNGYVPSILGTGAMPAYTGYKSGVNPAISTEFSTVGFRFGHSLLSSTVGRDNNDGTGITDVNPNGSAVNLTEDFFRPDQLNNNHVTVNLVDRFGNPDPHTSSTVGEIMKALADGLPNEFDLRLIDEVRNILFGIPHGPGTDLGARDIQRTRDHGIGTYNQVRAAYHLAPVTDFTQISSDPAVQAALRSTYGTVDKIDPFIGMLAEDHLPGSDVGATTNAILVDQFTRLRDGDRFFFQNETFNSEEQGLLGQGNSYAAVIKNNTSITNLQADVFFNKLEISGTVFFDADGGGVRSASDPPLQGFTVNLLDDTGAVVASTTTDATGKYDFTEQSGIPGTGNFSVTVALPPGWTQSAAQVAANPGTIALSRGNLTFANENFAVERTSVNLPNGFAGAPGLDLNGSARVNGSALQLTNGGNSEAGSAFTTAPVSVAKFSTQFDFQLINPNADGITFTLQNVSPGALGGGGGGLGYQGIAHSLAIKFDLYNNAGEGSNSTGLYLNGAAPTNLGSVNLNGTPINLHSGHAFNVELDYNGKTLTEKITDDVTGFAVQVQFAVNIAQAIGSANAFVGFTGGTGGLTATQDILDWAYSPITIMPSFDNGFASPSGLQGNGSVFISGSRLRLTDGGTGEAASVFTTSSVDASQFATTFTFQLSNANADGFTFTLQGNNPSQLGAAGSGLGYQGITNSVAIKFDLFNNAGEGSNSTGLYLNGAAPTNVGSVDMTGSGINLHSGDVFSATLGYDGTTLTETVTDTATGATFTHSYTVNILSALGRDTAFVGFTGATGGLTATQDILTWNFTGIA